VTAPSVPFPPPLDSYPPHTGSLLETLAQRATIAPFNAVATGIFVLAIAHTFGANRFLALARRVQQRHDAGEQAAGRPPAPSVAAELLHLLGEVEVVFGLWAVALIAAVNHYYGWSAVTHYLDDVVDFTEPLFVFVIMAIASSRPIVTMAERALGHLAQLGGGTPAAWWVAILTAGPLLGSLVTEPAAMTVSAVLLGRQFYALRPSARLAYATLGCLFVNVSVGGTLTHFAAPPVVMVARAWHWDTTFMVTTFGWRASIGLAIATAVYFLAFRREFRALGARRTDSPPAEPTPAVPAWIVLVHAALIAWTIVNAHHPALFLGGFLFFLGFAKATAPYQSPIDLTPPLLVAFFLAGLVIHGGVQAWWIGPVLQGLGTAPLFVGAAGLTAFNDNALITYLATLVPSLGDSHKLAVVAGAVSGGGLTVIANAPNPAGRSILAPHFADGISPLGLAAGALLPTLIVSVCFLLL
jgi:putative Na+/H+ antiporter